MRKIIFVIFAAAAVIFIFRACAGKYEENKKSSKNNPVVNYTNSLKRSVEKSRDAAYKANKAIIQNAVRMYRTNEGCYPASLDDIVRKGYIQSIPPGDWKYDGGGNLE